MILESLIVFTLLVILVDVLGERKMSRLRRRHLLRRHSQ